MNPAECSGSTGFARLRPWQARLVLAAAIFSIVLLVAVTQSPLASGYADAPSRGPSDVELYRGEVDRIRAGESYYAAANVELRARGYPTRSIFNWRMPLPVWLIGALPDPLVAKGALAGASLLLVLMSFGLVHDSAGPAASLGCGLVMLGAVLPCFLGDLFVMPELWSGVAIALSAVAYGLRRPKLGLVAGLAALFLRELAAPYCVLCLSLAAVGRRRGEVLGWLLGIGMYGLYFVWHVSHVLPLIGVQDVAHEHGWIRFGGAGFVISTVQMNGFLLLLPQWVTAIYLALALLGFAGWQGPSATRIGLAAAIYTIGFCFVGQSFNQYWGSMTAPLLCLGVVRGPAALRDLWRAADLWSGGTVAAQA